jgi:hypothetical protein
MDHRTPNDDAWKQAHLAKCGAYKGRATPEPSNGRPRL